MTNDYANGGFVTGGDKFEWTPGECEAVIPMARFTEAERLALLSPHLHLLHEKARSGEIKVSPADDLP